MKFDHIGIVARTLAEGRVLLEGIFEITGWTAEFCDPVNGVYVQFCRDTSKIVYEVIAPLGDHSPIQGALSTRTNILNHVAYTVANLSEEHARLRSNGVIGIGRPKPAIAYGGKRIQFFVTPARFILEIVEAPDHEHIFDFSS
jgi:methylmalonyl-CoA/ethylmalonyl-CoA epimerase